MKIIQTVLGLVSIANAIEISDIHTGFDPTNCPAAEKDLPKGKHHSLFGGSDVTQIEGTEATNFFGM